MSKQLMGVIGIVLIAMLAAFTFPGMITEISSDTSKTTTLDNGESEVVTNYLEVTNVESGNNEVTVTATNLRTGTSETLVIQEGSSQDFELDEDTVSINADTAISERATLTVGYARTFGWDSSALWVVDNFGLLIVIVTFVSIMAGVRVVVQ